MSKNSGFGKFLIFCTAVGAAAAGTYYYLTKREAEIADGFDDDFDDFEDDFDDDLDDDREQKNSSRKYVDIKKSDSAPSEKEAADLGGASEDDDEETDEKPSSSEEFFDDEDEK